MNRPELLAPAGDLERLKWAIDYGADAVYLGGKEFSLRSNAKNFSLEEIKEGCEYAHARNKKVYVTVNILFHENDTNGLIEYLKHLEECKVDAIISSDLFILDLIKKENINIEFHLSTQKSSLNSEAVKFYLKNGVKRVVLARECSLDDMKSIKARTNADMEVFIHGAMCMGYSGRCTLSNYFTNRDSNRGACAQICRWVFDLYDGDEKVSNETKFSFAPKDQQLLLYIKELMEIGVNSFKIEGRMKSVYYLATILSVYRKVIDGILDGTYKYDPLDEIILRRCANRESLPQYVKEFPGVNEQYYMDREEKTNQDFLGVVLGYDKETKEIILEERNYFSVGDKINIFSPGNRSIFLDVKYIKNEANEFVENANHPREVLRIPCDTEVNVNDLIRVDFIN
ncbi:MAG: U32 family peptidase [Bacilli bacterium]|nr:U32 family peptidase [Bacilli bacterium]